MNELTKILSKYNIPVDIEKIIAEKNIKVDKYCVDLNDDEKGRLNKDKDGYTMQIGALRHLYEKRYIMAKFLFEITEKEKCQNEFANKILMPEALMEEIIDNTDIFDKDGDVNLILLDCLFKRFQVPKKILYARLKEIWDKKNFQKKS